MTANLPITLDMAITFAVLIGVLALFVRDILPPHLTAMSAMAILLATQVIDSTATLALFGNSATIAIACMFVLSAALERTGVIDLLCRMILDLAERRRILAIAVMMAGVVAVSAFMNNTPVVIVMAPVVIAVARRLQNSPSKYLIPLSHMAILGGACTLIGTSTNILVDGVASAHGLAPFSMFEISGPGLGMAVIGALFMVTIGTRLLPNRELLQTEIMAEAPRKRFLAEAVVPFGSPLTGKPLNEVSFSSDKDYEILDLIRNDSGARNGFANLMQAVRGLRAPPPPVADPAKPRSALRDTPLQAGDRLFAQEDLLPITQLTQRPVQRVKAMIATATILGVVGLAAWRVMPIAGLAIPGAVLVILTGCVSLEKAYEVIEWRILMLIFGMLGLSLAMEKSGAARLIVDTVADLVQDFGYVAVLAAVYATTSLLTELMSNNATAVLMTPIVIGVAQHTGLEPRPLVVAVMLGASASFATPIGYQTNTYVYNIGNYRFSDFLKIGVPMNLLIMVVATTLIPLFWPLTARP